MWDIIESRAHEKMNNNGIPRPVEDNSDNLIYGVTQPTLLDMPVELFLKICSYLDADFISSTLSKVCRRFEDILADNTLWRYWVSRRIKYTYPALPHLEVWDDREVNWVDACIDIDRETKRWTNVNTKMDHIVVKDVHFASVDCVLLVNDGQLCISGGRDRGLALWKVSAITHDHCENSQACITSRPAQMRTDAHLGWVWDLAADSNTSATVVYSASWDNTVKAWDLSMNLECIETFQCGMSALAVVTNNNLVMAGLYSRKVLIFDIRTGPNPVDSYKIHKGPVLALDTYGDLIASASEDKSLAIWDRRAGRALASDIKLFGERAYPVSLSWSASALYIGDSKGTMHLLNPERFGRCGKYRLWPEPASTVPASKITGIYQGLGSLIVSSDRGEIKCFYPSFPPQQFASLRSSTYDITKLQYQNDIMVVGTCDSALEFWIPSDRIEESDILD